jgi:hypothetical protein
LDCLAEICLSTSLVQTSGVSLTKMSDHHLHPTDFLQLLLMVRIDMYIIIHPTFPHKTIIQTS